MIRAAWDRMIESDAQCHRIEAPRGVILSANCICNGKHVHGVTQPHLTQVVQRSNVLVMTVSILGFPSDKIDVRHVKKDRGCFSPGHRRGFGWCPEGVALVGSSNRMGPRQLLTQPPPDGAHWDPPVESGGWQLLIAQRSYFLSLLR
jgi:hypothetical protein